MIVALLSVLAGLAPQGDLPRVVFPAHAVALDVAHQRDDRVVVKWREGTEVRVVGGRLQSTAIDLTAARAAIGARPVQPFFAGLDRELDELRARVLARLRPGQRPPADLRLYSEVVTAGAADSRAVFRALNALDEVEIAYPRERPVPPPGDVPPVTPSFVAQQGYRMAAPMGIDALAIQSIPGGWGGGRTLLDIEWGWWFDHEDIAGFSSSALVGPPSAYSSFNDHGSAVMGELKADHDRYGVSGLVPDVRIRVATDYPTGGYSVANAIVPGVLVLNPGDVMLLEAQANSSLGLLPTEWIQADFDAIQNATALGIVTVEAAGNGGVDLDDPRLMGLFDLHVRDSGALIVGATTAGSSAAAGFSCYGSRIDANGWGSQVTSTGYGDLFNPTSQTNQQYTSTFGGTSGASPIVTSAVVALLGGAAGQLDPASAAAVDYVALRQVLRSTGTAVSGPGRAIGNRPDLAQAFAAMRIERGLRLLDEPMLGQSFQIEITPGFVPTTSDAWALAGALQPVNQALPLGNPDPLCGRLLLDPASLVLLTQGTFQGGSVQIGMSVPADPSLVGARYYLQAITVQAASLLPCLTNSSMLYVPQ